MVGMRRSILLCLLLVALLLTSCGNVEYHNKKADDDISKAIYEAVGEDVYYLGKEETSKGVWHYEYLIWEEREDLLQDVVSVMNETIENERITEKVNVLFLYELPGGDGCAVRLCNYSDDELIHPDCMGLQRMIIVGKDYEYDGDYYNNPNSYITIPDIKYLSVCSSIHERAIAEGIDWQENWPDLEYLEVDCNHTYYVLNADDAISLAIDEELGDTVIYHRKREIYEKQAEEEKVRKEAQKEEEKRQKEEAKNKKKSSSKSKSIFATVIGTAVTYFAKTVATQLARNLTKKSKKK